MTSSSGQEIFIGLVGAVGTDLDAVIDALTDALTLVEYRVKPLIRLASLLRELPEYAHLPDTAGPLDEYIGRLMTAGDEFRNKTGRNDALALLGIAEVIQQRKDVGVGEGRTIPRRAYIIRSLKHPEEAKTLRRVYGSAFHLVAAYAPHHIRKTNLARGIAQSRNEYPIERHYSTAEALINRDEEEIDVPHGQNLRDTFHRADVFVDTTDQSTLRGSIARFIELVFGNTFHTPTKSEYAMFHANAAALRSAELGKQVGAAIANSEGDIVAVGTNEVPKAGGGLYWCEDTPDRREFVEGYDSNDEHKKNLLADTFKYLQKAGWFNAEKTQDDVRNLVAAAMDEKKPILPKRAQLRGLIEFGRAVHAEMAALVDAARRGVSVAGCTMYVTTFPCHLCARHIVAAGIDQVRYIEPYAKSLAAELYPDSIGVEIVRAGVDQVIFEPFVGIAPIKYVQLFTAGKRKSDAGVVIRFVAAGAVPRYPGMERVYLENEDEMATVIKNVMNQQGILFE